MDECIKEPEMLEAFVIDLKEIAADIENCFADRLKPAPKGIYIKYQLAPIMVPGGKYCTDRNGIQVELGCPDTYKQLLAEKDNIRCANGDVIIHKSMLKSSMLSDTPFGPYRGLLIAKAAIDNIINNFISWRRTRSGTTYSLAKHFTDPVENPQYTDEENQQLIREQLDQIDFMVGRILNSVESQINDWLDGKCWNIYTTTLKGGNIRIERREDFRIYHWTQLYERGEIKL